jgi:hypothetical protein
MDQTKVQGRGNQMKRDEEDGKLASSPNAASLL